MSDVGNLGELPILMGAREVSRYRIRWDADVSLAVRVRVDGVSLVVDAVRRTWTEADWERHRADPKGLGGLGSAIPGEARVTALGLAHRWRLDQAARGISGWRI